jgi:DNA topoisomerase I
MGRVEIQSEDAQLAGLNYVSDEQPGFRRLRSRSSFRYVTASGKPARSPRVLARIRSLAIPPAWQHVWICSSPNGHLQATGIDSRGRKQYRYHPRWREFRDRNKYHRMIAFGKALPRIRARVAGDLKQSGLTRRKILATIVRLLERTLVRIGNDEYARANHSYGLTTLKEDHVQVRGPTLHFTFRAKGGIRRAFDLTDRRLARIVRACQELPGQELFQYVDEDGKRHRITSADVNEYLHEIAGEQFTAKDFRTWSGSVCALCALQRRRAPNSQRQAKHEILKALGEVARRLANTVAVCRKCYVHPAVIEAYAAGKLPPACEAGRVRRGCKLGPEDVAFLKLLRNERRRSLKLTAHHAAQFAGAVSRR